MKDNTRQKLIDATYEEVYSHGYQGSALSEILQKAGVHKGSMYHYFANKKEMTLCALQEKMSERFFERYGRIVKLENNYLGEFISIIKDTTGRDFKRGCPIANIVQEMSNLDVDFNRAMKSIYEDFRGYIKQILDKAVENKEMKECDTKKLALYITSTLEGAILSAKASGNEQDYVDIVDMLILHINSFTCNNDLNNKAINNKLN